MTDQPAADRYSTGLFSKDIDTKPDRLHLLEQARTRTPSRSFARCRSTRRSVAWNWARVRDRSPIGGWRSVRDDLDHVQAFIDLALRVLDQMAPF